MKAEPIIAVLGATGVVGSELLTVLNAREFPASEVHLFASSESEGEVYSVLGEDVVVETLNESSLDGVDLVFLAVNAILAKEWAPVAVEAGAYVVDAFGVLGEAEGAALVVPEVNADLVSVERKILANPCGAAIQLLPVLDIIRQAAGLRRVVLTTFEAVSGAGKHGLDELWNQARAVFTQQEAKEEVFPHPIAFNCLPQIDVFMENGVTRHEQRIINEMRSVLAMPELKMSVTAVRVPVFHANAVSVNVETERPLAPDDLYPLLDQHKELTVFHSYADYPTQLGAVGTDEIQVGRVRRDESLPNGLNLWIVADNIRKGAALNAVQTAEALIAKFS